MKYVPQCVENLPRLNDSMTSPILDKHHAVPTKREATINALKDPIVYILVLSPLALFTGMPVALIGHTLCETFDLFPNETVAWSFIVAVTVIITFLVSMNFIRNDTTDRISQALSDHAAAVSFLDENPELRPYLDAFREDEKSRNTADLILPGTSAYTLCSTYYEKVSALAAKKEQAFLERVEPINLPIPLVSDTQSTSGEQDVVPIRS